MIYAAIRAKLSFISLFRGVNDCLLYVLAVNIYPKNFRCDNFTLV